MFRSALVASLIAGSSAFAPAARPASASSALQAASPFAEEIGAQVPLGFWDPLGICADGDKENFDRLRYVEIKVGWKFVPTKICFLKMRSRHISCERGSMMYLWFVALNFLQSSLRTGSVLTLHFH